MFEVKDEEQEYHPDDMKKIAIEVLNKTTKFQVENLWAILNMALMHQKEKDEKDRSRGDSVL